MLPGQDPYSSLYTLLGGVPDPRDARGRRHHVADVLFIALVAVIAVAEDAQAIEDYATENESWFRGRCGLRHGIPSQDTYLRVLAAMKPKAFGEAFHRWVSEVWGGSRRSPCGHRRQDSASQLRPRERKDSGPFRRGLR